MLVEAVLEALDVAGEGEEPVQGQAGALGEAVPLVVLGDVPFAFPPDAGELRS